MSAFDAPYEPSPWEPIAAEVKRYEATNGAAPSDLVGESWMVLWTVGAQSGNVRKTPLVRVANDAGQYCVIGSQGGAPTSPMWVHNLRANPIARIHDGERLVDLTAREVNGAEREQWWAAATAVWPDYDAYAASTSRTIPVFVLDPTAS